MLSNDLEPFKNPCHIKHISGGNKQNGDRRKRKEMKAKQEHSERADLLGQGSSVPHIDRISNLEGHAKEVKMVSSWLWWFVY